MRYLSYEVDARAGDHVVVALHGSAANVKVMDYSNFNSYKNGRGHRYFGGHFTRSPARIEVPHDGHWYVTVDLGGYGGHVSASVSVQ